MQFVSAVDVTFQDITMTEIFDEGWIDDTLWVDEECFTSGGGFPRCKIEGMYITLSRNNLLCEEKVGE